tara:strand:+ start:23030 stop:23617 length:588 start_codon:yes stop_codon:yes gene_type:complete
MLSDGLNNIIIFMLILTSIYLAYSAIKMTKTSTQNTSVYNNSFSSNSDDDLLVKHKYGYNTKESDILLNPYAAPLRDDRLFPNSFPKRMPINIKTQGCDTDYRQIGILTRTNGDETILPLMGRPLIAGRDTWQFYTINDKNNSVKLPIIYKNKSCTSEHGCDNLYNNDVVKVQGYNDTFKVTVYDNNTMTYLPYL